MIRLGINRADVLLLVSVALIVVLLTFLLSWLLEGDRHARPSPLPSTYMDTGMGTQALYLTLIELGHEPARLSRMLTAHDLDAFDGLFMLGMDTTPTNREWEALEGWVHRGGVLVLVPFAPEPLERDPQVRTVERDTEPGAQAASAASGIERLALLTEQRLDHEHHLHLPLNLDARFQTLWADAEGPVIAEAAAGQGRVVLLSQPYPLSNHGLPRADNMRLGSNLLGLIADAGRENEPLRIGFDEFRLGLAERHGMWRAMLALLLEGPWGLAIAQVLVVAMLALWAAGRRFGRAEDVTSPPQRRQGAFAEAAGRLLRDAGAADLALQSIERDGRQRLCQRLHLPATADDEQITEALDRQRARPDLARLWATAGQGETTAARLLERTRAISKVLEALDDQPR